jgi:hypothetical protein
MNLNFTAKLFALTDVKDVFAIWSADALAIVERYAYLAFGSPTFMNADYSVRGGDSAFDWETLFCSYRFDSSTQLYHVRNRYLHSGGVQGGVGLGRWLSRDNDLTDAFRFYPMLIPESLYVYVSNRPTDYIDASGRCSCEDLCSAYDMVVDGALARAQQFEALSKGDVAEWLNIQRQLTIVGSSDRSLGTNPCIDEWEASQESQDLKNKHRWDYAWMQLNWNRSPLEAKALMTEIELERQFAAADSFKKQIADQKCNCDCEAYRNRFE